MKATLNQLTNETLYRGEDKVFTAYFYDSETFEPIDLSAYDDIKVCFLQEDLTTTTEVAGTLGDPGKFSFTVTAAQSALLAIKDHKFQVSLGITAGPTINLEVLENLISVVAPEC